MIESILLLTMLTPAIPAIKTLESGATVASHNLPAQNHSSITGFVFNQSHHSLPNLRVDCLTR